MILIRYVLRQFLATFLFTLLALCLLFVIIHLFENIDKYIDRGVPADAIVTYYLVYLPSIAKLVIPVASLLATLFSVGRMSTNNEVVAMRAAGQSTVLFLMPYMLVAVLISGGQLYFNGWIVPRAETIKLDLERKVLQEASGGSLFNLYFRDSPSRNVVIEYYDRELKTARTVAIEEYGSASQPRLQWRIDAPMMRWDSARVCWVADSATRRTFREDSVLIDHLHKVDLPFTIRHDQIVSLQREQSELTFTEIPDYIATLRAGGKDTRRQEADAASGWAFPFANVIVILIAVPFAAVRRKGGIAVNIAAAMVLAFAYIVFSEISIAVGTSLQLSPILVGWSANGVFALLAIANLLLHRR
jgi:lipopolysaccharide export system permease protein